MTWSKIKSWLRQPTTIHGIAVVVGGCAAAAAHLFGGTPWVDGACAVTLYAATNVLVSDNSADVRPMERLVEDAATAIVSKRIAQSLPALIVDVQGALTSLAPPAPEAPAAPAAAPSLIPVSVVGAAPASSAQPAAQPSS